MSKLLDRLYLLFTAGMLPLFTQCQVVNNAVEPDPVQIQETRLMYYDDYIYLRDNRYRIYEHEPKEVTISRCGDEFSIKGIFKKYPDAWIKGKIMWNSYERAFVAENQRHEKITVQISLRE